MAWLSVDDEALAEQLGFLQNAVGGVSGPFDSFLALRGVKTLAIRMQRHGENAQAIAEYLAAHPKVSEVHFPGLPSHPQHEVAKRQMHSFGGMVTAILEGGIEESRRFLERCEGLRAGRKPGRRREPDRTPPQS